jgi:hypothetical protein
MKSYCVDFDGWLKIKANSEEEAEAEFSHLYYQWEKTCRAAGADNTFGSMNIESAENN